MSDFHELDLEAELQLQLSDDTLKFSNEVDGGLVSKAALFRSQQTAQSYFVKYHPGEMVRNHRTRGFNAERERERERI